MSSMDPIRELIEWYDTEPLVPGLEDVRCFAGVLRRGYFDATDVEVLINAIGSWRDGTPPCSAEDDPAFAAMWRAWHAVRPWAADPEHGKTVVDALWSEHAKPYWLEYDPTLMDMVKRPGTPPPERSRVWVDYEGPDLGSHVQILESNFDRFPGGDPERFASEYARKLPLGWRDSIIVCLRSGAPIVIVRWSAKRERIESTRRWAEGETEWVNGDARRRWCVLETFNGSGDTRIPIPPAVTPRVRSRGDLAAKIDVARAADVVPLPIRALNAVLSNGGVPQGSRVILQGPPGSGKTAIAIELAAGLAADEKIAPNAVAWVATSDEPADSICRRFVQREGGEMRNVFCGKNLIVIDGREVDLEDVFAAGFSFVFVDSLQAARTRAGAKMGRLESVAAAVAVISAAKVPAFATSHVVRGAERRSKMASAYGGAGIEHAATLLLDVSRDGDAVIVEIVKSRGLGGEDQKVALVLDRERQRIVSPAATAGADAVEARIRADVLAALASGPKSVKALAEREIDGKAVTVRRIVKAMVAAGEITERDDGTVGLP